MHVCVRVCWHSLCHVFHLNCVWARSQGLIVYISFEFDWVSQFWTYSVDKKTNHEPFPISAELISKCNAFIDAVPLLWCCSFFTLLTQYIPYACIVCMHNWLSVCCSMVRALKQPTISFALLFMCTLHVQNNSISNLQLVKCAFHQQWDAFIGIEALVDFDGSSRNPRFLRLAFSLHSKKIPRV